jgi:predicted nuclease of predicted toxin-antitoxin system
LNLVCDEGVERPIVERLRRDGHDVLYVADLDAGASDDLVLARASENDALLITTDKDFGELVFRQGRAASGVILLRLAGLSNAMKPRTVAGAVRKHQGQWSYDSKGALSSYTATGTSGDTLFRTSYVRDSFSRITELTEIVAGDTTVAEFTYDDAGAPATLLVRVVPMRDWPEPWPIPATRSRSTRRWAGPRGGADGHDAVHV